MDYTYVATGGFSIFGCSDYTLYHNRRTAFSIGSILFSKQKALKGTYEKVCIKKILFPSKYINLYVDTFNALWNENELVSYNTAVALVKHFIDVRNAEIEENVRMCK